MTDQPEPEPIDDAEADDGGDELRKALSGMHKARAPATFSQDVTTTISSRSAGRFFSRRTLGDRVPFGVLLVVALLALLVVAWMLHGSSTGELRSP
jgi:type VI protein secretion system component VasF